MLEVIKKRNKNLIRATLGESLRLEARVDESVESMFLLSTVVVVYYFPDENPPG